MAHQWHPPPPPQFAGPPFQYQLQPQTPGQQQFAYNPPVPSSSNRQQYSYAPPINQARFDSNSQIPSPNGLPPQYTSAGFHPALFHHFSSAGLPPPPPPSFPPLPLPNGFSPFVPPPQISNNNFQSQYSPHGHGTQANVPPQPYRTIEQHTYNPEQNSSPKHDGREKMDLNEEDPAAGQNNSGSPSFPLEQGNSRPLLGMPQRQNLDVTLTATSDRTDSVSSYNPPSATPPESDETATVPANAAPISGSKIGEPSKYHGRGAFEMRELAKGALLSLAPHNIKFADLLAEGINPQLLSQLFEEVGLKTTTTVTPKAVSANTDTQTIGSTAALPRPDKLSLTSTLTSDVQPPVESRNPPSSAVLDRPNTTSAGTQQTNTSATIALPATRTADSRVSGSPPMERKDVIAAMLAAKMGKPLPRKESPAPTPVSLPAKAIHEPSTSALLPLEPHSNSAQPPSPKTQATDDSANKASSKPRTQAQTELVRQKLEQLKRDTAAKTQSTETSQTAPSPSSSLSISGVTDGLPGYPQVNLPPKPVSYDTVTGKTQPSSAILPMGTQQLTAPIPSFNPTFTSSIPGLFMMDTDPDPGFVSSFGQGSPMVALRTTASTDNVQSTLQFEAAYATQIPHPASADFSSVSRESSSVRNLSKRPRAVDAFDEEDLPPLKQQNSRSTSSREKDSMSLDRYSDDMSDGEIMEIEEGSPVSPLAKATEYRSFPNESSSTAYRQSQTTAQSLGTSGLRPSVNGPHTVAPSQHELELEAMKKKLAEAEERRRSKQNPSQPHPPALMPGGKSSSPRPSIPPDGLSANAPHAVDIRKQQSHQPTLTVQRKSSPLSNRDDPKSSPQSVPVDSVQRAKELREKLLRQRMLKQGLPELDKEVQKTQTRQAEAQARLAQLRHEAEKREQEAREARRREQEIMEEVKRLEQQLEMGVSGQQQFSQEIKTLDEELSPQADQGDDQNSESHAVVKTATTTPRSTIHDVSRESHYDVPQFDESDEKMATESDNRPDSNESISDSEDEAPHQHYNDRLVRPSAEAALPTAEEEAAFLQTAIADESASDQDGLTSPEDSGHLPGLGDSTQENSASETDDSPMELDPDSDGSASMSDSGSEDYEPTDSIINAEIPEQPNDEDEEYNPTDAPIAGTRLTPSDDEAEEYQPSEQVEPLETEESLAVAIPVQNGSPISEDGVLEKEPEHGDDREHGVELTEANTLTNPQDLLPSVSDIEDANHVSRASESSASRFTPYQSALRNLKSYRFHPQFSDGVSNGYRSLTYSNFIDPTKPLCPTEAEGGECKDVNCQEQHFGEMRMADEKILVQMSSATDIPDRAQRDRFLAGLKLVIADLSAKQISEFEVVAAELAAYRRRFRQEHDPSLAFTSDEL